MLNYDAKKCNYSKFPTIKLHTDAVNTPVTLAETKLFLRIDAANEDALINKLISTATIICEKYTGKTLITKKYIAAFEDYLLSDTILPRGPVQSIDSISLIDKDGGATLVDSSLYSLNDVSDRLILNNSLISFKIEVLYNTGFGANVSDIPVELQQGILTHIARMYDSRCGDFSLPKSSIDLYNSHRAVRI